MDITRLSTKGQVVIPEAMRKNMDIGTAFSVIRKDDLIILKKVESLTQKERKEIDELNNIWKDIEEGKGTTLSKKEFLKEMNAW